MSNEVKSANVKELAIVTAFKVLFKLDEAGRAQSFFTREIKNMNTVIRQKRQNIASIKLRHEGEVDMREEGIEDAKLNLTDVMLNIDMDRIKNNANKSQYSVEYWNDVKDAEDNLKMLRDDFKSYKEEIEKDIAAIEDSIKVYQNRIDIITNFNLK